MAQLALNRFQTETAILTTSDQTIYTAPAGYTGIILYAHVTNYGASATTITCKHVGLEQKQKLLMRQMFL